MEAVIDMAASDAMAIARAVAIAVPMGAAL